VHTQFSDSLLIVDHHPDFVASSHAWLHTMEGEAGKMVKILAVRPTTGNRLEIRIEGRLAITTNATKCGYRKSGDDYEKAFWEPRKENFTTSVSWGTTQKNRGLWKHDIKTRAVASAHGTALCPRLWIPTPHGRKISMRCLGQVVQGKHFSPRSFFQSGIIHQAISLAAPSILS